MASRTDPLTRALKYQYDNDDNLVGFINRRGQQVTYAYDALNRLTKETYVDAVVQRQYDSAGRLVQVVDSASGTFTKTYDAAGRLTSSLGPNGSIAYGRDANGRVTSRQVKGQSAVTYTYDGNGNMSSAALGSTSVSRTYDARNALTANTRSNGVAGVYSFDPVGRPTAISEKSGSSTLISRAFTYDLAGQITSAALSAGLELSTHASTGTFDAANELTTFGSSTYTNDADGNRLAQTTTGAITAYAWDARGRLQSVLTPDGAVAAFVYDYAGNMIQERVKTGGSDAVQTFVLDDVSNIVSVQSTGATPTSVLDGRSPDNIIATIQGGSAIFPLADQIGSVAALTDASGSLVGREFYEPYGAPAASGTPGLFQFTGRPLVSDGLYYYRARFYDSATGRFLSADPLGISDGSNPYRYAGGNPLSFVDPSGLWRLPDYISGNINIAIPNPWTGTIVGWSGTASLDRYGNWYWSPLGVGVGKSATLVSGSLTANWLDQRCKPGAAQLDNFLTANGFSGAAGFWGGVTQSYTPGAGWATGVGFVSPQIGVSYNYSFRGGNLGFSW